MTDRTDRSHLYALGDSLPERQRLLTQAERLRLLTRRFLKDAGLASGMRVLELGCGPGDVTALLAELVGPEGEVVALEGSPAMLAEARDRAAILGLNQVSFRECALDTAMALPIARDPPLDAVVGRLILTHLPDPATILQRTLVHLRPGGVVAFQEADFTLSDHLRDLQRDRLPLVHQVCEWIDRASRDTSVNRYMGRDLHNVFLRAGLPAPTVTFHTEVYGGLSEDRVKNTVMILRNLLPRLLELGVRPEQIGLYTLEERLCAETAAPDLVQARASIASAWAVKGDA